MIKFPSYLPNPDRIGFGFQHTDPMRRTEMQSGRARQRQVFTSVPSAVQVEFVMTPGQGALFEAWYANTISNGVDWFEATLSNPIDGGAGTNTGEYECRFTGIYSGPVARGATHWVYSGELEVRERPLLPPEYLEFPDYIFEASILDQAVNREWPEA